MHCVFRVAREVDLVVLKSLVLRASLSPRGAAQLALDLSVLASAFAPYCR